MYYAFFVNTKTGELKRISEPWPRIPPEWRQITEYDYELYKKVIEYSRKEQP